MGKRAKKSLVSLLSGSEWYMIQCDLTLLLYVPITSLRSQPCSSIKSEKLFIKLSSSIIQRIKDRLCVGRVWIQGRPLIWQKGVCWYVIYRQSPVKHQPENIKSSNFSTKECFVTILKILTIYPNRDKLLTRSQLGLTFLDKITHFVIYKPSVNDEINY